MVEGHVWQEASVVGVVVCMAMGACMVGGVWRGHALQGSMCGGGHACSKTATEGGGTHPTGMHSCFVLFRC